LRIRRGVTRKSLAQAAEVSERHLANVEMGVGNASILFLRQIAQALNGTIAELVGDEVSTSPEWFTIREMLRGMDEAELARARGVLSSAFGSASCAADRLGRVALVGLRGAGKATLGRMLAQSGQVPFIEIDRRIEEMAGCSLAEIHSLYGAQAYRRYEKRAVEDAIRRFPRAVIAAPGDIVSEAATFDLVLAQCYTVWVRATPQEHMRRVLAQGDARPVNGSTEAMSDLRRILDTREPHYAKADKTFDTSEKSVSDTFLALCEELRGAIGFPV
jgi:XRE family aerobic/anaerobic benzoate catabolism transcriptional regulator